MRRLVIPITILLCCVIVYAGWKLYSSSKRKDQTIAENRSGDLELLTKNVRTKRLDIKLKPIYETRNGGSIDISLSVGADTVLSEIKIFVQAKDNLTIEGPLQWVDSLEDRNPQTYTIPVTVPKGERSTMLVYVSSQIPFRSGGDKIFFNYTGDTLSAYDIHSAPKQEPRPSSSDDPIRDTLTEEQLHTVYDIVIDVRKPEHLESAERILGSLSDSTTS